MEYKQLTDPSDEQLNELAALGWEVAHAFGVVSNSYAVIDGSRVFVMKRKINP